MNPSWRALVAVTLVSSLPGCGMFDDAETTHSLVRETRDDATGTYFRLWYWESVLDSDFTLEIAKDKLPVRPDTGRTIMILQATDTPPTLRIEQGCYVFSGGRNVTRFEEKHWLSAWLFGKGVDLKPGDRWTEMIEGKSICFRLEM